MTVASKKIIQRRYFVFVYVRNEFVAGRSARRGLYKYFVFVIFDEKLRINPIRCCENNLKYKYVAKQELMTK